MKQSNAPKVSVLMSAYNCAEYLGEAIESILNQTFDDYEFIIINNASPDNCIDIIRHYAKLDTRIRVINNVKNINFGAVQQQLIEEGVGEYLAFVYGDDIQLPYRLARQVEFLDNHSDVGLLSSYIYEFGDEERERISIYKDDHDIKSFLLSGTPIHILSVMFRRSLVDKHGVRMPSKFGGSDPYKFYIDAANHTKLAMYPEILAGWRRHDKQCTAVLGEVEVQGHDEIIKQHLSSFGLKANKKTLDIFHACSSYKRLTVKESIGICNLILSIASIKNFYEYSGVSDKFLKVWKKIIKKRCPRYIYEIFRLILLSRRRIK